MNCPICKDLKTTLTIKNGSDLSVLIRAIKSKMMEGIINEEPSFLRGPKKILQAPFEDIASDALWPDSMEYYFRCLTCHQVFHLDCEILSGKGGLWAPTTEHAWERLQVI